MWGAVRWDSINLLHTNRVSYPQAFGLANCHGLTPIIQHAIFLSCKTVIVWVPVRAFGRQDIVRDILVVVFLGSRFGEFKIADDPLQLQRDNKWVGNRSSVSFWIVIE